MIALFGAATLPPIIGHLMMKTLRYEEANIYVVIKPDIRDNLFIQVNFKDSFKYSENVSNTYYVNEKTIIKV